MIILETLNKKKESHLRLRLTSLTQIPSLKCLFFMLISTPIDDSLRVASIEWYYDNGGEKSFMISILVDYTLL